MLDNHSGSNDDLNVFETALFGAEPEQSEPTEEIEAVDVSEEEAEEVEPEDVAEESEAEEAEEESEESETEETEEEQAAYEVVIDGQTLEVTQDELLSGYQRQADYTRKTQAVADQRKELESQSEQVKETLKGLEESKRQLSELLEASQSAVDWEDLRDTDPSEYLRQKELIEQRQSALKRAEDDAQKATQLQTQEEAKQLFAKVPTWSDPKQRDADRERITAYLSKIGFAENEYSHTDHRLVLALLDASKYQEMQNKSASVVKKIKKAPKVTKPGKKLSKSDVNRQALQEQMSKFRKSGRDEDGLEVFKALI
jgi:hypothetical protein